MRPIAVLACLGAVIAAPMPAAPLSAAAETAGASPSAASAAPAAPAEAATPAKLALVRRYLAAIQYEKLMDQLMSAMLPMMVENMSRQHPQITPAQRQEIAVVAREVMRDTLTPRLIERMAPIYAETFTEAELTSIVDFYESPVGRAVTAKTPALAPKAALVVRDLLPEIQGEMSKRVCERLNCAAPAPPQRRPS